MIKEAVSPLEPQYDDFAGGGLGRKARRLFVATRPKFLTASVLPVLVGTAWGAAIAGHLDFTVALIALVATALVHAASNVINDVGDDVTGTDRANVDYIHPYTGGSRFITNQVMSLREMHRWAWVLFGVAALLGLVLAVLKGPLVILLGIAGIALAVLYSAPSVQLSGKGVGEITITLAFGVLPVCGAAWLQSSLLDIPSLLIALPVGLWVMLILLINEVPDRKADGDNGKRTLVVRLGLDGARHLYRASHVAALASIVALIAMHMLPWWVAIGGVAILAGGFKAATGIAENTSRAVLTKSIEMTIGLQAIGSIVLFVGALFAG